MMPSTRREWSAHAKIRLSPGNIGTLCKLAPMAARHSTFIQIPAHRNLLG